jgi:hypothetical protein
MTPSSSQRCSRIVGSLACLASASTFLAAQIDFVRRHRFGISPEKYWLPQLSRIWIPGLGFTLVLGVFAFALHRRGRRA